MKTILSIEESARLIELGVDPKLASNDKVTYNKNGKPYCQPIYSLADLLSILPKEIEQSDRHPMTVVYYWNSTKKEWISYYDYVENTIMTSAPELIDALYQLLIWCLTENKINLKTNNNEK